MEHKKIIFLGLLYDKDEEDYLLKNAKTGLQGAANTFQWSLINGLDFFFKDRMDIISCIPVGTFPRYFKKLVIRSKNMQRSNGSLYSQTGFINIPFIKQLNRKHGVIKNITERIKSNKNKKINIICYSLYKPFVDAALYIKKRFGSSVKVCMIVPDLPGKYGIPPQNILKKAIYEIRSKKLLETSNLFDSYVLLTEQMRTPLNIGNKPYVVVEGVAEVGDAVIDKSDEKENRILFSGTINRTFGIQRLLQAFEMIKKSNYKLIICGNGDMKSEVEHFAKMDKRIEYLGYVNKERVKSEQSQASVLVNPRIEDNDYVKYSFPSKTMEYLLSGKPVIMNRLSGVPDEYYDFIICPQDESAESLAKEIERVCELSLEEKQDIGRFGRDFVIKNKSSKTQAEKIVNMIGI